MQVVDVGLDKSAIWWDSVWKWGILPPSYGHLIGKMMIDHCIRDESHNFQTNLYKSLQISRVASIRDIVIDCLLKNTQDRLDSKIGHCKSNLMVPSGPKIQWRHPFKPTFARQIKTDWISKAGFAKALYSSRSRLAIMNSSTALVAKFTMTSMKQNQHSRRWKTAWNHMNPYETNEIHWSQKIGKKTPTHHLNAMMPARWALTDCPQPHLPSHLSGPVDQRPSKVEVEPPPAERQSLPGDGERSRKLFGSAAETWRIIPHSLLVT